MEKIKADKEKLREFALVMAAAFLAITALILFKHKHSPIPTALLSGWFVISGLFFPLLLKPIFIGWMKLAFLLSWINTRLILVILFYFVFSPIGIVMKAFGVDLLERKIDRNKDSYWKKRESKPFEQADYEHQF